MISTHRVEVVPVELHPIPGADRVSRVDIFGFTCVTATEQWKPGDLGAWIPPDNLVDTGRPEFSFLKPTHGSLHRVKAKKIRGVLSFGLLIKAPEGSAVGDDVTDALGVTHYEPEVQGTFANAVPGPKLWIPKYDVESGRRYRDVISPGERVYITEKLHGANARYVYHDGAFYCGSRNEWKEEGSIWHRCLEGLKDLLSHNPDCVVFGELYGNVKGFPYDCAPGEVKFRVFDMLVGQNFLDPKDTLSVCTKFDVPHVPVYAWDVPFDFEEVCELAEGKSVLATHVREGVVVCPSEGRTHEKIGRVKLKYVGAGYLEKS